MASHFGRAKLLLIFTSIFRFMILQSLFLTTLCLAVASANSAPPCEIVRGMQPGGHIEFAAKLATPNIPQAVELRGQGPLFVVLQRTLLTYPGNVRIEIANHDQNTLSFNDVCQTDWLRSCYDLYIEDT